MSQSGFTVEKRVELRKLLENVKLTSLVLNSGKKQTTTLVSKIKKEDEKPIRNLIIGKLDKDQAKVQAVAEMSCGNLSSLTAVSCLYQIGISATGELSSPWVSYGKTLTTPVQSDQSTSDAVPAYVACPMHLLDIKTTFSTKEYETTEEPVDVEEDWKVLLAVVAHYRLSKSSGIGKTDYRKTLLNKVLKLLDQNNDQNWFKGTDVTFYPFSDPDVEVLVALWDMFFHKFPKHQLSKARWGTQVTRYKDCGILETLRRTANSFGFSWRDLAAWSFHRQMKREFKALLDTEDEIDDEYGYLPYQSSLRLVEKSPYSASANPNIHLFCKMYFAMRGDNYGYNAVVIDGGIIHEAIISAFILLLAYKSIKKKSIMSAYAICPQGVHQDSEEAADMKLLPVTQNAEDWHLWYSNHNCRFPESVRQDFLKIKADAKKRKTRNRKGSVGEALAQYALSD